MNEKAPSKIMSTLQMKCPNCRKGNMFMNQSIFPIKEFMKMFLRCQNCNLKFERELGFWYGTGYVSYAISVGLIFVLAVFYALIVGFTYKNNSIYIFICIMIFMMVILQPWIMRYARVLYVRAFVRYKQFEMS
jgi:uncharacterized protein (DUF983 family)